MFSSSDPPLTAGIIGAGVAGLSAAIALRRAGWNVELFEKSSFQMEIGAAMTVASNATRVLDKWGFDFQKTGAVEFRQIRILHGETLAQVVQCSLTYLGPEVGHRTWAEHRVDLHDELRKLATAMDGAGTPARVRLSSSISKIDCQRGIITTENYEEIQKDLIVVADGAHSTLTDVVVGQKVPITKIGRSAFRALVPMDRLREDKDTRVLFENEEPGFLIFFDPGDGRVLTTYPCRNQEVLNCAFIHQTRPQDMKKDNWNAPSSVQDALNVAQGFHPAAKKILEAADEVKVYTVHTRPVLDRYTNGRAVVIGDAAHTMLPMLAQGGSVSIEDGAALEVLFAGVRDASEIPRRLKVYQNVRLPRDAVVQILSNADLGLHHAVADQVHKYLPDFEIPGPDATPFSPPWAPAILAYDTFGETKKAMEAEGVQCFWTATE